MSAVSVPELKLYQIINALLSEVSEDYNRQVDKTKTLLHHLFGEATRLGKYNYLDQAVSLFVDRKDDNPRKVNLRLMYDAAKAGMPTMHITMPSENEESNTIGVGESGHEDSVIVDELSRTITPKYNRRFRTTYHIVCTSDSSQETFLMYHVLRAVIISALDYIDLAGLKDPKLSGQDIRQQDHLTPNHIYMRGVGLSCLYMVEVPRYFDTKIISNLILSPKIVEG